METNQQTAPYPTALAELVDQLSYKAAEGWEVRLADKVRDRGPDGEVLSKGLTLVVLRTGPDSYHPETIISVNHYFPVPPATYNRRAWTWWLFNQIAKVEQHELMENFKVAGRVVYAPTHGPGCDPYQPLDYGTEEDRRMSFRGELCPE